MSGINAPGEGQQAQDESLEASLSASYDDLEDQEHDLDNEREDEEMEAEGYAEVAVSEEEGEEGAQEPEPGEEEASLEAVDYDEPAPERWPDDLKNAYNSLSPAGKKAMLEGVYKPMQRQYTKSTQELAAEKKALGPMLETLQRHSAEFESAGINPVEAFNRQMAWSAHFAKVGPEQGAKDLAAAYGQAGMQNPDQEAPETAYMTPVEKAQKAEIDRLNKRFDDLDQQSQQRTEAQQRAAMEARANEVRTSIQTFSNEMRDGKLAHPHVDKLSAQMAGLIRGGLVHRTDEYGQPVPYIQQLGQAYQIACDMDPNIRTARMTRTRQEQVARATAANREVVSKTPGADEVAPDTRPLSESLGDLYDRLDRSAA